MGKNDPWTKSAVVVPASVRRDPSSASKHPQSRTLWKIDRCHRLRLLWQLLTSYSFLIKSGLGNL